PYAEALERFGIDRPDLRFGLELKNLTTSFAGTSFKVFADVLARGQSIYGINLPAAHQLSRRELDEMTETLRSRHSMGLAWVKVAEAAWQGPVAKYLSEAERTRAGIAAQLKSGDTLLMIAGDARYVRPVLADIRLRLGSKFGLQKAGELRFLWVV